MKLIDVQSRDIFCLFEIPLNELRLLKAAMDSCELKLDLSTTHDQKVDVYFKTFYAEISDVIEKVEENDS